MEALWLKQFSCIDRMKQVLDTGLLDPPNKFFVGAMKKLLMLWTRCCEQLADCNMTDF
jgi:hypothetical protein